MILFKAPSLISFSLLIGGLIYLSIPDNGKMGMYYFNSYEYDTAYKYLNDAKNFENGDIEALKKIKDYFLINGNTAKALSIQYKLILLRPHNIGYHLEAEKLCDWNKRPIEKLMVMEKRAVLLKGDEKEALFVHIAEGYRWLKLYKESTRMYKKLKKSTNRQFLESSIEYYLTKKDPQSAIEVLEHYVDLFPGDNKYATFLIQSYSYVGQKEKAFWQTLVQLGLPPSLIKGDFASWIRGLKSSEIRNKWKTHSRLLQLSQEVKSSNWRDTLISLYSEKLKKDTLVSFTIGESYFLIKNYERAYKYFRRSEVRPHNFREVNQQLAIFYSDMKRPKDSIRCLERLVRRFPRNQIYWESLGDNYEEVGAKQKAVRAYLKLLKLESSSFIDLIRKRLHSSELYTQASGPIIIPIKYKSVKAKEKQRKLRKRVKDKVLAVAEGLADPNDRIEVYKEILNHSPNDIRVLKNLGFSYFDIGETTKGQNIFARIFQVNPMDRDALEVIAGVKTEQGDFETTLNLISKLEERKELSIYALGLRENALYSLGESQKHKDMCAQVISSVRLEKDYLVLKNRCLSRLEKAKEALLMQQELVKNYPEDNDLLLQKAFSELDAGNISAAQDDIALLKKRKIQSPGLNKYLDELESIVKQRDSVVLFTETRYLKAEDFSYIEATQNLRKRVQSFGFGTTLRSFKLLSGGDSTFHSVSPYISYFHSDRIDASIGYQFGIGDKNIKNGLFLVLNYYGRHSFFNATFENSEALVQTRNLVLEKDARARTLNLYWEKFFSRRKDLFTFNTTLRWATFRKEEGQARQFTAEYLYSLMPKHKLIDFYAGAQVSRNTLTSDGVNLNLNFLPDSLSYHMVFRAQYGYQSEDRKHWRFLARVASGGDSKRGVDFAKSWQLRGEATRFYGPLRSIRFYSEYYNETVGVNLGSTFLLGINWTHRF